MKIKIKSLITYIFVMALFFFVFCFNHRRAALFFIVAMVLYLVFALVMQLKGFILPSVKVTSPAAETVEGGYGKVSCIVSSRTFYPFVRISACYKIRHTKGTDSHHIKTNYSVFFGSREYGLDLKLDYCGVYEIIYEELLAYDLFGIFARRMDCPPPVNIVVMPKEPIVDTDAEKLGITDERDTESDPLAGDDVSEIKELRDYRDGDRLSQVHWKLSSKSEDLIVKEYAKRAGACIVIVCLGDFDGLNGINDYYGLLYGFGLTLLASEIFFELVYYNCDTEDFEKVRIDNPYLLRLAMEYMFFYQGAVTPEEALQYFEEISGASRILCLGCKNLEFSSEILAVGQKASIAVYDGIL